MSALAESSLETTSLRQWLVRGLVAIVVVALIAGLTLWLKAMMGTPTAAKRQVAKISILPDTPPPPPPPPKVERKPEPPKDEVKQGEPIDGGDLVVRRGFRRVRSVHGRSRLFHRFGRQVVTSTKELVGNDFPLAFPASG